MISRLSQMYNLLTALDPGHNYLDTDLIKVMSVYGFKR